MRHPQQRLTALILLLACVTPAGRLGAQDNPQTPLQHAGRRNLTALDDLRYRLDYVLTGGAPAPDSGGAENNQMTVLERWLIARLQEQGETVESAQIVEQTLRRLRGETVEISTERWLEVIGRRQAVQQAEQFLDRTVHANRQLVLIEARLIRRPAEAGSEPPEVVVSAMNSAALGRRRAHYDQIQADVLVAPRLIVFGGQHSQITVGEQASYISRIQAAVVDSDLLLEPVLETVWNGVSIELTPIISPDGQQIHLSASLELSNLKRPMDVVDLSLPTFSGQLEIQVPELNTLRWSSDQLVLSAAERALEIQGLRLTEWNEKDGQVRYDLSLLLELKLMAPEELAEQARLLATVLGYDPRNRTIFARLSLPRQESVQEAGRVTIRREGRDIGHGYVVEIREDLLIIRLEEGQAREGDRVRAD